MSEELLWAIFLPPFVAFLVIVLIIRPFLSRYSGYAGFVAIISVATSLILALLTLRSVLGGASLDLPVRSWFSVGELDVPWGLLVDPLTVVMLIVVSSVSLMVQVYSQGYMKGDQGYARYFAYMSLFTAAMIGLVMARGVVQFFVFWELVGLCSYLLIGFWYQRSAAVTAAKKAFLVTRVGDMGFLVAMLYLVFHQEAFLSQGLNPLDIEHVRLLASEATASGMGFVALAPGVVTLVALGLFAGAVGKSAQIPLHTWLPDAMEGPTPASALIHAATMVAAGVFLVARFFPIFEASSTALTVVALTGGVTAFVAASMGLVMFDIKRVLAYSTISQLGYMMVALGVAAPGVAIFHLVNHAFFKALLFMGAGSVSHSTGTFDMRYMGGLRKTQPWTYATFLVASLSLAGFPLFSGFWSKDAILGAAWERGPEGALVFWLLAITSSLTAAYIFRVLFLTFHGSYRGNTHADMNVNPLHSKLSGESPWVMIAPMVGLASLALFSGVIVNAPLALGSLPEHWLETFLHGHIPKVNLWVAALSVMLGLLGAVSAFFIYQTRPTSRPVVTAAIRPIHSVVTRKYFFDEVYEEYLVKNFIYRKVAGLLEWFDSQIIEGSADFIAWLGRGLGRMIGRFQNGQTQTYGTAISFGVLVIVMAYMIWGL